VNVVSAVIAASPAPARVELTPASASSERLDARLRDEQRVIGHQHAVVRARPRRVVRGRRGQAGVKPPMRQLTRCSSAARRASTSRCSRLAGGELDAALEQADAAITGADHVHAHLASALACGCGRWCDARPRRRAVDAGSARQLLLRARPRPAENPGLAGAHRAGEAAASPPSPARRGRAALAARAAAISDPSCAPASRAGAGERRLAQACADVAPPIDSLNPNADQLAPTGPSGLTFPAA